MNKLQWEDSLCVGVELIDRQHKQWIDHFNRAAEAVANLMLGLEFVARQVHRLDIGSQFL